MMSKITAIASRPKGNTMSIGWTGCPKSLALLSIHHSCALSVQAVHRCHLSQPSDSVPMEARQDGHTTQRHGFNAANRRRSYGNVGRARQILQPADELGGVYRACRSAASAVFNHNVYG